MQINQFHLGRMRVNAIASLDFNSGLTCFLIDLFHFQLHMQQINGEMFMFFYLFDHNFFFTQFLKSDTPKISIQRDLMSPVAQIDWFLFFNEFFFLKHKTQIYFPFNISGMDWWWCICICYPCHCILCSFDIFFVLFQTFFSLKFFSLKLFSLLSNYLLNHVTLIHNYFGDFNTFRRFIDIISLLFGK